MLLARKGLKVLVVDNTHLPADIPHGHLVHKQGPRLLHKWGVLENIVQSNCPPVTKAIMDLGDFPLTGTNLVRDGVAFAYGPRRRVLDAELIDAAVAAGAEFRPAFSVDEYLFDGDAVAGIRAARTRGKAMSPSGHRSPSEQTVETLRWPAL
jgi:flavin-dependent dehydrogenase